MSFAMSLSESAEPGSLLGQQAVFIKTEPMTEPAFDTLAFDEVVEAQQLLYLDHEVKEEMVIGPTEIQRPKQAPEPVTNNVDLDAGHLLRCRVELRDARDELQCGLCGEWSLSAAALQRHTETHAGEASDTTPTDNEPVPNVGFDVKLLLCCLVELRDVRYELQCGLCGEWSLSAAELQRHKQTHAGEASDTTPTDNGVCARGGECSAELRARATPHDNGLPHSPIQRQLESSQCQSSSDASLQSCHSTPHQRNHSAAHNPYVCHDCHKVFRKRQCLVQHVLIHSGVKQFTCNVCDKKFARQGHLIRHKNIHIGIKPFACDVCDKKFTRQGHLKRHKQVHTGERVFVCDVCGKKLTRPESLITHKRVHSGERPFACDVCYKKFTKSVDLRRHKKVHNSLQELDL